MAVVCVKAEIKLGENYENTITVGNLLVSLEQKMGGLGKSYLELSGQMDLS